MPAPVKTTIRFALMMAEEAATASWLVRRSREAPMVITMLEFRFPDGGLAPDKAANRTTKGNKQRERLGRGNVGVHNQGDRTVGRSYQLIFWRVAYAC